VFLGKGLAIGSEGMSRRGVVGCLGVDALDLHLFDEDPGLCPEEKDLCQPLEASNLSRHLGAGRRADHDHDVAGEDRILEGDLHFADPSDEVRPGTDDEVRRGTTTTGIDEEARGDFAGDLGAHSGGNVQEANPDLHDDRLDTLDRERALAMHVPV